MANVHGIRDLNNQNNRNRPANNNNYQNLNQNMSEDIPFMSTFKGDDRLPMD